MRKNIVRDSINCLGKAQLEDTTYKVARDITLCYLQELEEEYKELEEENKRLKCCMQDTYDSANDICGELQQKIDKAIEYIKNKAIKNCWLDQYESCELIKILKGENNEKN